MASELEELRRRQAAQEAALREQRRNEKDERKARKGITKAQRKEGRSKARQAAKSAYPESKLILVYNGRPIAVREVERPAAVVRATGVPVRMISDAPIHSERIQGMPSMGIPMDGRIVVTDPRCHNGVCEANTGSKRSTAKKTTTKKNVSKAPAKKTSPKKTTTKKNTTKKAPAKKTTVKKPAPKKCGSKR